MVDSLKSGRAMKNQYNNWSGLALMLLFIIFGGCEKKEFTLPVELNMKITVKNEPVLGGSITIDEIGLGLNSIDIRGYREQGGDVFLTRVFDEGKKFVVRPSSTEISEKFDIPQGIYNPISFSLVFEPDPDEIDLIDDILDWLEGYNGDEEIEGLQAELGDIITDYLEDITPCIILRGMFTYNNRTKNIVIVVNDPLTFQLLGKSKNGGSEVTLDRNIVNTGNLQINPSYWFSVITPAMLDDAFTGMIDEEEYIFLSKYVNSHIYGTVFNRMEESTILTINQ